MPRILFYIGLVILLVFSSCANHNSIVKCPDFRKSKLATKTWASNKKTKRTRPSQRKVIIKSSEKRTSNQLTIRRSQARLQPLKALRRVNRSALSKPIDLRLLREAKQESLVLVNEYVSVPSKQSDDCDILHTYDKEKISCVVKEITPDEVRYVPCADPDAAVLSISRSEVKLIVYSDGRMQIVDQATREAPSGENNESPVADDSDYNHLATLSITFGLLGLLLFMYFFALGFWLSVLGVVFGVVALFIFKKQRHYRGKNRAIWGIVSGGVVILVVALLLRFGLAGF